jgi:hypothetical protein
VSASSCEFDSRLRHQGNIGVQGISLDPFEFEGVSRIPRCINPMRTFVHPWSSFLRGNKTQSQAQGRQLSCPTQSQSNLFFPQKNNITCQPRSVWKLIPASESLWGLDTTSLVETGCPLSPREHLNGMIHHRYLQDHFALWLRRKAAHPLTGVIAVGIIDGRKWLAAASSAPDFQDSYSGVHRNMH